MVEIGDLSAGRERAGEQGRAENCDDRDGELFSGRLPLPREERRNFFKFFRERFAVVVPVFG